VLLMFAPPSMKSNISTRTGRANIDERRNAGKPGGLLRALFDDQVHDSRAWFLIGRSDIGVLQLPRRCRGAIAPLPDSLAVQLCDRAGGERFCFRAFA
jgi:hypothetical protein